MLTALRGTIRGNTVVVDENELQAFDGAQVVITILDDPKKDRRKMTAGQVNELIAKYGQPELLTGSAGLAAVRETLKNDVW